MKKLFTLSFLLINLVVFSQIKKTYNIGILIDANTNETEPLVSKLKEEIIGVVGEDAFINFSTEQPLSNNFNANKSEENYNTLLQNETDIILSLGTINGIVLSKRDNFPKATISFSTMLKEEVNLDTNKLTSGIPNYTYLYDSGSFKNDLNILKETTDFNKVGVIINNKYSKLIPVNNLISKICNDLKSEYSIINYNSVDEIPNLLTDVDAIYLPNSFFLNDDEVKFLAQEFINRGLPSLTNSGKRDVENGIMISSKSEDDFDQFIRRIALTVEDYINNKKLEDLPVTVNFSSKSVVNFNTAKEVKTPLKLSLIEKSEFTGSFTNSKHDEKYNIINFINKTLENNLELQKEEKNINLAKQNVKTASSNYMPNLTANANALYVDPRLAENSQGFYTEFSTTGNITLQQTLFSNKANASIGVQKKQLKAAVETFNSNQLNTVYNASANYFNTLILKSNAEIRLKNLDLTKKNLQLAEQNYKAGQSGKSDMLRFKSEMAQNTQFLVEAYNALKQGYYNLNQLVNNPVDLEIDIEDTKLDEGIFEKYNYSEIKDILDTPSLREHFINFLVEEAKTNAPELKALNYNIEAIERNIKLNGGGRLLPTLGLQGQYNTTFTRSGAGSEFNFFLL